MLGPPPLWEWSLAGHVLRAFVDVTAGRTGGQKGPGPFHRLQPALTRSAPALHAAESPSGPSLGSVSPRRFSRLVAGGWRLRPGCCEQQAGFRGWGSVREAAPGPELRFVVPGFVLLQLRRRRVSSWGSRVEQRRV